MNLKSAYRNWSDGEGESKIPLMSKAWWLDAVCGPSGWDVAVVEKDNKIVASLPYVKKRKFGLVSISSAPLTKQLGPWLTESKAKYSKRLGQEKDLMQELVEKLPSFHWFSQNFSDRITNWMPFYWLGFRQSTRYTYKLTDLTNLDAVWEGIQPKIKTDIRKAANKFELEVCYECDIDTLYRLILLTYKRQGRKVPFTKKFLLGLDASCAEKEARCMLSAKDKDGNIHAAIYIVFDDHCCYYLLAGSDPQYRNSGANSFLLWEAVKFSATVSRSFDFEGSMVESIERFFRGFGAVQTPYSTVKKSNSKLVDIYEFGKSIFGRA